MDCLRYIYNYGPKYYIEEEDESELGYEGTYTKHPVQKERTGSYHTLVESRAGQF